MTKQTVLIIGASSGIGAAAASIFVQTGYQVIGTSRKANQSLDLPEEGTGESTVVTELDVTKQASVDALLERLTEADLLPDILIVNAGFGIAGAIEDTPTSLAQQQFETNFFGAHRVIQAFLPHLRMTDHGKILLIGSLAAEIPVPFQGFYSASKAALASYAEVLHMELAAFKTAVMLFDIGDHKTDFGGSRVFPEQASQSEYEPQATRAVKIMEKSEALGPHPDTVAKLLLSAAQDNKPKRHYIKGSRTELFMFYLRRFFSRSVATKMVMDAFKVPS